MWANPAPSQGTIARINSSLPPTHFPTCYFQNIAPSPKSYTTVVEGIKKEFRASIDIYLRDARNWGSSPLSLSLFLLNPDKVTNSCAGQRESNACEQHKPARGRPVEVGSSP